MCHPPRTCSRAAPQLSACGCLTDGAWHGGTGSRCETILLISWSKPQPPSEPASVPGTRALKHQAPAQCHRPSLI